MPEWEGKLRVLEGILSQMGNCCIAFSAGVDSTCLLAFSAKVLPGRVMAVMAVDAMIPEGEEEEARAFCKTHGIPLEIIAADAFSIEAFRENHADRCYHCKKGIFTKIGAVASEKGYTYVVEGSNADDLGDYRPGMRALKELGIRSPLLEAGLTKAEIRALALQMGLEAWDKPAGACLATRVPYDTPLTPALLQQIGRIEAGLSRLGLRGSRARLHGELVRVEVPETLLQKAVSIETRTLIVQMIRGEGYAHVCIDLEGYVKGSMNRSLSEGGN